mmetsp:Transcript_15882/g.64036  ORF Transcript_15882/g.64036 Transcript_15882/m.64036 type:complete len:350 (+) Transcript_15882:1454-2503(+)
MRIRTEAHASASRVLPHAGIRPDHNLDRPVPLEIPRSSNLRRLGVRGREVVLSGGVVDARLLAFEVVFELQFLELELVLALELLEREVLFAGERLVDGGRVGERELAVVREDLRVPRVDVELLVEALGGRRLLLRQRRHLRRRRRLGARRRRRLLGRERVGRLGPRVVAPLVEVARAAEVEGIAQLARRVLEVLELLELELGVHRLLPLGRRLGDDVARLRHQLADVLGELVELLGAQQKVPDQAAHDHLGRPDAEDAAPAVPHHLERRRRRAPWSSLVHPRRRCRQCVLLLKRRDHLGAPSGGEPPELWTLRDDEPRRRGERREHTRRDDHRRAAPPRVRPLGGHHRL